MKPQPHRSPFIAAVVIVCALAALLATQTACAADGTWNVDASGAWNLSTNWAGSTIADGNNFTANFANDITADRTVTLGVDRTIGNITFGDSATGTAGSWLLTGNTLTLASTGHTITVNALGTGKTATISSIITGTSGLIKTGAGTLILTAENTYTGGTVLNQGTLIVTNVKALSPQSLTLSGAAVFDVQTDGADIAKSFVIGSNNSATIASDVATGTVGINHSLGTMQIGATSTLNITKGFNVASGTSSITFTSVLLGGGQAGTSTFNPTTASLSIGAITSSSGFAKTLKLDGTSTGNTITGNIDDGPGGTNVISLTKSNTSTWTLGGNNTYTGDTIITGSGTAAYTALKLTSNTALGDTVKGTTLTGGTGTSLSGVSLELAAGVSVTGESLTINASTGRASLLLDAAGSAAWNGDITISDSTQLAALFSNNAGGSLTVGASSANTLTLASGKNVTLRGVGSGTISSTITGGGSVNTLDGGTWTLTAANTYTGQTNVSGGTLIIANASALGSGSINLSGGGTLSVQTDGGDAAHSYGMSSGATGTISSDVKTGTVGINHTLGALVNFGNATLNITKGTHVASGSASITFTSIALGAGAAGTSVLNPTTASLSVGDVSSTSNFAKNLQLDGTSTGNAVTGTISDGTNVVSVTKANTSTWTLGGTNTYSGTTTISGGFLAVTGTTGTGAVTVQNSGTLYGTGTVNGSSFVAQSGSTILGGNGTTQTDYGTLNFTPVTGSGSFDFQSGSSVILGINPGGIGDLLNFNGLSAGTLNFNGNLSVTATGYTPVSVQTFNLLDWANLTTVTFASRFSAASYTGYLLGNGDDNKGFDLPDISGSGYAWDISQFTTNGTISTVVIIPEPSRILLLFLGLTAFVLRRKRQG